MTTWTAVGLLMIVAGLGNGKAEVRLSVVGGRPVVNGVYLNGQGPFRFLLDTGARTNQVGAAIARKLGLRATFRVELETATGVAQAPGGRVAEVTLGAERATDLEFLFTTLGGVHQVGSDIQGVLGQEFLGRFDYLLDLRGKTLVFEARTPAGERVAMEPIEGRPSIATNLGRLVLDSGTDTLVLFHSRAAGTRPAGLRTASGFLAVKTVANPGVRVGGQAYRAPQAAILPRADRREDGLLPLSVFQAVYVCNSEAYVVVR